MKKPGWLAREPTAAHASLAGQLLYSAAGLACTAIAVKLCTAEQFGVFALVQSAALLTYGIIDSAFLVPLMVRQRPTAGLRGHLIDTRHDFIVLVSSLIAALAVAGALWLLLPLMTANVAGSAALMASTAVWGLALIGREWLRQRQLLAERHAQIVATDLASASCFLVVVSIVAFAVSDTTHALTGMAFAFAAVGIVPVLLLIFHPQLRLAPTTLCHDAMTRTASWSLASAQISWVQSQSYLFMVAALLGPGPVGAMAATRLAFVPIQTVVTGLSRGWLADLAAARGARSVAVQLLRATFPALAVTFASWTLLTSLALGHFAELLDHRGYEISAGLLWACASAAFFSCGRAIVTQVHRARGGFRYLTAQGALGAMISVVAVPTGAIAAGALGAVGGLALAECITCVWGITVLLRSPEVA